MGFPGDTSVKKKKKKHTSQYRRHTISWFDPWVRKIWRRAWQLTPVSFPGEFHRQRSLAGYSPWGRKESDTTEQLSLTH